MNLQAIFQHIVSVVQHQPFLLVWVAVLAGSVGWKLWKWYAEKRLIEQAKFWPSVPARVVSAQVIEVHGEDRRAPWKVLLTYSYNVSEVEVGDYTRWFDSEYQADSWANSLQGGSLTVRVNPSKPNQSYWLDREDAGREPEPIPASSIAIFTPMQRLLRLLTIAGAAIGAALSTCAQLSAFAGGTFLQPQHGGFGFFGMHIGAMASAAAMAYLSHVAFPKVSARAILESRLGVAARVLLYVLNGYTVCVFLLFWARGFFGFEQDKARGSALMFSSVWTYFFLTAGLVCWSIGKSEKRHSELDPENR